MGRPRQAATLLKSGSAPWQIAQSWGISHKSVVQYLYTAVGLGLVSRSEILFAIHESAAQVVEETLRAETVRNRYELESFIAGVADTLPQEQRGAGRGFLQAYLLYFDLRDAPVTDMYESLCRLERFLHGYIRKELQNAHGPKDWWRKGIPSGIRKDCRNRCEDDPEAEAEADPYSYTTFIHLKEIFDKQWGLFSTLIPTNTTTDKQKFLSDLTRANSIRNKVMHPVRGYRPTRDDYDFVKDFVARVFGEPA